MSEQPAGHVMSTTIGNDDAPKKALNPITQNIIQRAIKEVLTEYVSHTKRFTADSLHAIRNQVTEKVKQRLGEDEITSIDVGFDLTTIPEIPFFYTVNIPEEKQKIHIIETQ